MCERARSRSFHGDCGTTQWPTLPSFSLNRTRQISVVCALWRITLIDVARARESKNASDKAEFFRHSENLRDQFGRRYEYIQRWKVFPYAKLSTIKKRKNNGYEKYVNMIAIGNYNWSKFRTCGSRIVMECKVYKRTARIPTSVLKIGLSTSPPTLFILWLQHSEY